MTEAALQKAVLELAKRLGWRVAHFRPAQVRPGRFVTNVGAEGSGFPDLVLVRGDRLVFAELKMDGKYPGPKQREWHQALQGAGASVCIWKPRDWASGAIEAALT